MTNECAAAIPFFGFNSEGTNKNTFCFGFETARSMKITMALYDKMPPSLRDPENFPPLALCSRLHSVLPLALKVEGQWWGPGGDFERLS